MNEIENAVCQKCLKPSYTVSQYMEWVKTPDFLDLQYAEPKTELEYRKRERES